MIENYGFDLFPPTRDTDLYILGNLHDRPLEYLSVILQADFRCLHDVKLRDIFPEWHLFQHLPPTITNLCIRNQFQPDVVHGSMDDVFALLKKLVRLRKLEFANCLSFTESGVLIRIL